jgi:sulfonate transport system substrate-binding protein
VQRVVSTLVKSAAWSSDERNRTMVLESWATSPEQLVTLASANAGSVLKLRMSPLMDEAFTEGLRRDSEDAKRFGLVEANADMSLEGWIESKYVQQALRDLHLEGYWPERDAGGRPKDNRGREGR